MSFRLKTILGVALIEAILLSLLVWNGLRFIEQSATQEFLQRAHIIAKTFAMSAKDVTNVDHLSAAQNLVQEALHNPDVLYVRIRDKDHQELASAGDPSFLARPFIADSDFDAITDGVFDIAGDIRESDGTRLGQVELGLSANALQELEANTQLYSISLALLGMGLVAVFSFTLSLYLNRQLGNLSEGSRRMAAGELGYQVPVRGQDELAETAQNFNRMSAHIHETCTALAEREAHLRRILENIQDGILTLDREGHILSFSPAAESIFIWSTSEVLGHSAHRLFGEEGWPLIQALLAVPDQQGPSDLHEIQGYRPDGQCFPLEIRLTPLSVGITLAVVRDISARRAAEAELRLSNRIIEDSINGVLIADARQTDFPIIYVNQGFVRITGYPAEEVIGKNCRFLQGSGTDPESRTRIRHALREQTEIHITLLNYTKQGREFWNDLSITPIRDKHGQVTHFVALQNDITERVLAQREVAAREAYLRRVLNSTHDAIIVIDAEGIVESFNTGAETMFGYQADEVIGHSVSLLIPSPHRERHDDYLRQYYKTGQSKILGVEREFEAQRKNGSTFPMALRVNEMKEEGTHRFIGVIHDITGRKLTEDTLRHAKEAAEAAAEAKSQFLANISHEIRTPIHGVLGALEMLRDTALNPPQRRYLDTANTSAEILLALIDEILDFSRLEAGKLRVETLDFELRRTVEDVTTMLGQGAHAKRLELVCFIASNIPDQLKGDPIRLRQILSNLVGNAIKFTQHGEVVVNVTAERLEADRILLRFEVRDTGIGIAADKQALLFQPFIQADGSTSRRFGGTGLGLSIARRLVELMGGEIGLSSQPEIGSQFWFRLPFGLATAYQPPVITDFSGRRLLIVDDNATSRAILYRYLSAWGIQPGSAGGGEEALAKLQDAVAIGRPYPLVLLDFNMPGMGGLMLAKRLRQDPALAGTRLLLLSSSSQDSAIISELKIDIWLDKPVRQSELRNALATIFNTEKNLTPVEEAHSLRPGTELHFTGERVLLVEDNTTTQQLAEVMLNQRGFMVDIANNGLEAVSALRQESYAIVLMDVQMPELDGFETTRRIRAWEAAEGRTRIPIIALTAHALPTDRDRCLAAGMNDYLVKPYSSSTLSAMMARWLAPLGQTHPDFLIETAPPLDPARLTEVRDLMGPQFANLLTTFAATARNQLQQALNAHQIQNNEALLDAVHRLKNTAGDIGAMRLHAVASALEQDLKHSTSPSVGIDLLEQHCREAVAAAERLLMGSGTHER